MKHPQLKHRDVLQTVDSRYGPLRLIKTSFQLKHDNPSIDQTPPTLNKHTDKILAEARYTPTKIERLRHQNVV